jgi:hypothetical protein
MQAFVPHPPLCHLISTHVESAVRVVLCAAKKSKKQLLN